MNGAQAVYRVSALALETCGQQCTPYVANCTCRVRLMWRIRYLPFGVGKYTSRVRLTLVGPSLEAYASNHLTTYISCARSYVDFGSLYGQGVGPRMCGDMAHPGPPWLRTRAMFEGL